MKPGKYGWWILVAALPLVVSACSTGNRTSTPADDSEPVATTDEGAAQEKVAATPVVIYFKAEPSEADLEWLRDNGFVIDLVKERTVSGHFERDPSPEFSKDPRLDRIVPLAKPPSGR